MSAHPKRPAWLSLSLYGYSIGELLRYVEAEDRAYCRIHGIPFHKRKVPEYRAGPHPRSAFKHLPLDRKHRVIRGQIDAFTSEVAE